MPTLTTQPDVLVVESDAICLLSISGTMETLGLRCKRNTSGARVLEQVREMRPRLILIDLELPNGDPLEIAAALRADITTMYIPIVGISDEQTLAILTRYQKCLFAGWLTKPISRQALSALVNPLMVDHGLSVATA